MPLTHATTIEGYDAIRLRSATAHLDATFVPAAGMVGASLRDGGRELLGRGSGVHCYARGGTTMGIPLLHPWANRLAGDEYRVNGTAVRVPDDSPLVARDEHGLPIHGLLGGSALRRRTLTVRTTLTATGAHPVPVSFGFHPYLRLPDVAREDWQVELPAMRRLELDERSIPTGASRPVAAQAGPLGARTFDDGYVDVPDGAEFVVAGGGRRVTVAPGDRLPGRAGLRPGDGRRHLLRADDGADERAGQPRPPAARGPGRALLRGVLDHRGALRWSTVIRDLPRPAPHSPTSCSPTTPATRAR